MIRLLVTAGLLSDPVARVSARGDRYATFTLRSTVAGEEAVLISCIAFDSGAVATVLECAKGEVVTVTGKGSLRTWTGKDGTQNYGLACGVDGIVRAAAAKRRDPPQLPAKTGWKGPPGDGKIEDMPNDLPWQKEEA
jgi:single-stranded DNA-binding protein